MSVTIDLSEAQLKTGVVKLAVALVGVFALVAVGIAALAGRGQGIAVNILLVTVAFSLLTNGVVAILKIVDWFEKRKRRNG